MGLATESCVQIWLPCLRELLREREKGVLRAAHPRTTFQGEYPPGFPPGSVPGLEYHYCCMQDTVSYSPGGHSNGNEGYQARPWTHKKHPNHVLIQV